MKWVLSPAGITTYAGMNTINYKFYKKILNDNSLQAVYDTDVLNLYEIFVTKANDEYDNTLSFIKRNGYILFNYRDKLSNLIGDYDDVVLPINHKMNHYMSVYQLKFLKNNIANLNVRQQFFINSFLLSANHIPISDIFVENECLNCICENKTNHENENDYSDAIKYVITNKCKKCKMLKYKNKIKLINEFIDHIEEKDNMQKLFEYYFNECDVITSNKTIDFHLDNFHEWHNDMIKLDYINIKNSLSES